MDLGEKIGLAIVAAIWAVNGIIEGVGAWTSGRIRRWGRILRGCKDR